MITNPGSFLLLTEDEADDLIEGTEPEGIKIIEGPLWEAEDKFDHARLIIQSLATEKYHALDVSRVGTSYTGYEYDYELKCPAVFRAQRTVCVWQTVGFND